MQRQLTLTERQVRALANVVSIEHSVGAVLSISNDEYLTQREMADLERRLRDYVDPVDEAAVEVNVDA